MAFATEGAHGKVGGAGHEGWRVGALKGGRN